MISLTSKPKEETNLEYALKTVQEGSARLHQIMRERLALSEAAKRIAAEKADLIKKINPLAPEDDEASRLYARADLRERAIPNRAAVLEDEQTLAADELKRAYLRLKEKFQTVAASEGLLLKQKIASVIKPFCGEPYQTRLGSGDLIYVLPDLEMAGNMPIMAAIDRAAAVPEQMWPERQNFTLDKKDSASGVGSYTPGVDRHDTLLLSVSNALAVRAEARLQRGSFLGDEWKVKL